MRATSRPDPETNTRYTRRGGFNTEHLRGDWDVLVVWSVRPQQLTEIVGYVLYIWNQVMGWSHQEIQVFIARE